VRREGQEEENEKERGEGRREVTVLEGRKELR
jgi:hypothetical protein